ncbi:MAG: hypothetical protein OXH52_05610 [Gammaproteobacteria bacterium]|nr:hypothetical protein [Gammaproteobacteria bacterium]
MGLFAEAALQRVQKNQNEYCERQTANRHPSPKSVSFEISQSSINYAHANPAPAAIEATNTLPAKIPTATPAAGVKNKAVDTTDIKADAFPEVLITFEHDWAKDN